LSSKNHLYRRGWVSFDPQDVRVINSDEQLQGKMELWGQPNRNLDGYDEGDDDMSFSSLNPEQVGGLFGDGENIYKAGGDDEYYEEAVDDGPDAEAIARELIEQAHEELEAAKAKAEKIVADAYGEIEYAKRSGREEGKEIGYNEGRADAVAETNALKAELQEEREKLRLEYDQLIAELEPRFVKMITDIYQQIFNVELKDYGPIVAHLIANVMRDSDESKNFIIRVSKDDFEYVSENRAAILEEAAAGQVNIEIIKDQTLSRGACLIETAGGIFDAGFDTQLEGLNKKLRLLSYE